MLDLQYIYDSFKSLTSIHDKINYLRDLQKLNLNYDINYENLIRAWEKLANKEKN